MCCITIELNKLASQIWITRHLDINYKRKYYTELLCKKLYRCEINSFRLIGKVIIFDDLKLLVSSVRDIVLWKNSITYKDGSIVMLDAILECFSNIRTFDFDFGDDTSLINPSRASNLMKLQNLGNLKLFTLRQLPEIFAVEDLSAFLKKFKNIHVSLSFNGNISHEYKNQLAGLVDQILEAKAFHHILYEGQDEAKKEAMRDPGIMHRICRKIAAYN
uniref:Uncharacterized protein n=1 Tax=Panagrolaimus superbus TaxID=310955 RepID=A0A914YC63_9BILA